MCDAPTLNTAPAAKKPSLTFNSASKGRKMVSGPWEFISAPKGLSGPWEFISAPRGFSGPWEFISGPRGFSGPWGFSDPGY